jgi:acetylornithine deacetylase/succinyl-diaminopimelate desuccinylase-like protein
VRPIIPFLLVLPLAAQTAPQQLAREVFQQLIEIDTTNSAGDNTKAAEAMAARFRAAGYPASDVQVLVPMARKGNVVVRLRGTGEGRPVLFIGHLDVVEAKRSDWSFDPFVFREQDGYFFGRGTQDMKADDAILVTTFLRLKQEGFQPKRDLILALTSDEEGGPANGVSWLVKERRDLIDAEFCINPDGGSANMRNGHRTYAGFQAAEKTYASFTLEVKGPGGHSSLPTRDNVIYRLAEGLTRLAKYEFPVHLFDVTRTGFERRAGLYEGQLASDLTAVSANPNDAAAVTRLSAIPVFNAQMRTTCVATMVSAGHAENALPQTATATVNCRILPVDHPDEVEAKLREIVNDPEIKIARVRPVRATPSSPIEPKLLDTVAGVYAKFWPGVRLIPEMSSGGTDGTPLRIGGIPTYGVTGIFLEEDDIRAHGRDERVPVQSFYAAVDFMYELVKTLSR